MQSLGHACIFCTSNPKGQTTFFAPYILSGNSLSFGSIFFNIISNFQIPCQIHHSLPSIAAIPVWYPAFSCHLRNLGTTISCDPLTCTATSTSPSHLRSFSLPRQWADLDHQRAHLMPLLQLLPALPAQLLPPLLYHRIQGTHGQDSCRRPLLSHCLLLGPLFLRAWSNSYSRT